MVNVGQVVMKIAGRDAGKVGVIAEIFDKNTVLVDGFVRRRKCNVKHLEFLDAEIKIKKSASSDEILKVFNSAGFEFKSEKRGNRREAKEKPKKLRKSSRKKESEKLTAEKGDKNKEKKK